MSDVTTKDAVETAVPKKDDQDEVPKKGDEYEVHKHGEDADADADAEALAVEEKAEDDVAKQLRSIREAMDNGPIDCLLKVRKYEEMLLQDHEARGPAAAAPEHRDGDKPSQGDPPKPAHLSHGSCPSCSKGCSSCYCSYHIYRGTHSYQGERSSR